MLFQQILWIPNSLTDFRFLLTNLLCRLRTDTLKSAETPVKTAWLVQSRSQVFLSIVQPAFSRAWRRSRVFTFGSVGQLLAGVCCCCNLSILSITQQIKEKGLLQSSEQKCLITKLACKPKRVGKLALRCLRVWAVCLCFHPPVCVSH